MSVKSFILNQEEFIAKGSNIYKYMPLERALDLLETKSLWFANPERWNDPYESRFISSHYDGKTFAWKNRVFCCCFTSNLTSEASWNAYSNNECCIQFAFDRKTLLELLNDYSSQNNNNMVYFDSVEYMRTNDIKLSLSKIPFSPALSVGAKISSMEFKERLLLLKRKAFEYEKEYRAIVVKPKSTKENGIKISIPDIHELIIKITIGPKVEKYTTEMLKGLFIKQYSFDKDKVIKSQLYTSLPKNINIKK